MADIDLLVVNHNTQDKMERLLQTLHSDDNGVWDLYVADNGSTDGSSEYLAGIRNSYRIEDIWLNENVGYARAVNRMAEASGSRYLAALNADVWLTSQDVHDMVRYMNAMPDVAIAGPKQRDEGGRITHGGIMGTYKKPKQRGWLMKDEQDSMLRFCNRAVSVSGAAYFVRRSVWDALATCPIYVDFHKNHVDGEPRGAMPAFKHFYEETLMSYHLSAHPELGAVYYNGGISIGHTWHASSPKNGAYVRQGFREGQKLFRTFCDMHGIEHD